MTPAPADVLKTDLDRRRFLAASGLAATMPLLPTAAHAAQPDGAATSSPALFSRVDFTTDGLGLNPREYATRLHEAVMAGAVEADGYSRGGLVEKLERRFAEMLGKQAAMFVPTGTLANHLAIRKLAGNDRRVLVQAESHFYNDSGDCASTLSGLNLVPLAAGESTVTLEEVRHWVERSASGRVETKVGVLSIESPVRRRDHQMVDVDELQRVCRYARERGIRLHLDGARMFNLPRHSGRSVREYAALFDTVFVSLWKHFNGMSGAILAGDAGFIDGLYHTRRMFGGSLPHAWPDVAPVEQYLEHYERDYAQAWQSADRFFALLQADARFKIRHVANGTSRFFLSAAGVAPDVLGERLERRGVTIARHVRPDTGELPMEVNPTITRMAPDALARIFFDAMNG